MVFALVKGVDRKGDAIRHPEPEIHHMKKKEPQVRPVREQEMDIPS
jgi:hypothetical protein